MPHAPDLAGCVLDGRYELHELIGEGTFGRVYRGHDRRLAREVAIKVIKPWWAEDPEWAESFGLEAQLLARVSDPGIVQIYDVGQAEEGLYYVTELVDGESLAGRLRRGGRMAPWEACDIAEQLCRALEHAHAEQIVHRDIKPANVLISSRGKVKVGDLGIARLAEGTTEGGTATIVGTPRYMAPEQASGLPVTPATDVYSAGIVLYEMLAGHPPFNGDTPVEIALRHVQEPPAPLPAGTPRSLERIVLRALAKEAGDRYQSAAAMAEDLALARARASSRSVGSGADEALTNGTARYAARTESEPTLLAPRFTPRKNVNPAARRRTVAVFVLSLALLGALVLAAIILTARPTVAMPQLHGLGKRGVAARLGPAHLTAAFSGRYDEHAKRGTVVGQTPGVGTRVKQDSTVDVVLSKGPRPIPVPSLSGKSSGDAVGSLHALHLSASIESVPAPGTRPGLVIRQSPSAGHDLHQHQTVTLYVAETPRWQSVTSFSGEGGGQSSTFKIQGSQWRVVYQMSYDGTCDFVLFCDGPSAQVLGPKNTSFGMNDGSGKTKVFTTGPGVYQIQIQPGLDNARWSFTVEDWY
jgi:eukaryotic-like serine/threonine-protein kinase